MSKRTNLVIDLNNIAFTTRHNGSIKTPKSAARKEPYVAQKIFRDTLSTILFYAQKLSVDAIFVAADSRGNWRKDIYPDYKNRDHKEDLYYAEIIEAIQLLEKFFREQTAAIVISTPLTEADDIIAHWCFTTDESIDNIILSSDQDYYQLHNSHTRQYSTKNKEFICVEDPAFELFVKCIRGDVNDNIRSAFPRVRITRLKAAWENKIEFLNLVNEHNPVYGTVHDALEFNQSLIDLSMAPQHVVNEIENAILEYTPSRFNELKAIKFLGDHDVKNSIDLFKHKAKAISSTPTRQ